MYSSSKGTSEARPFDATTARRGPALAAATTDPDTARIIVPVATVLALQSCVSSRSYLLYVRKACF